MRTIIGTEKIYANLLTLEHVLYRVAYNPGGISDMPMINTYAINSISMREDGKVLVAVDGRPHPFIFDGNEIIGAREDREFTQDFNEAMLRFRRACMDKMSTIENLIQGHQSQKDELNRHMNQDTDKIMMKA